mgnify:CR=1 FL=1
MADEDGDFLNKIIAGDETWCYLYDPVPKRQSSEWKSKTSPRKQKFPRDTSKGKVILNVMFYLTTLATAEVISASPDVPEFCPAGVLLHASKSTDMSLSHLSTLKCHRPGPGSNPQPWA